MKKSGSVAVFLLYIATLSFGSSPTRMDIFDASDNHLLFVTFEYTGDGVCTGRNVYTSDSTFLYHTKIQSGTNGAVKEISEDYLENRLFTSTITPSESRTDFSTVDQFNLPLFGPALNYTQSEQNTFEIKQNNSLICKEKYEYDSTGALSRIVIFDKNGQKAWYATIGYKGVGLKMPGIMRPLNSLRVSTNRGSVMIRCKLNSGQFLSAELLTPSGRRVKYLVKKEVAKGDHVFICSRRELPANGAYIVRVSTDDVPVLVQKIFLQK